MIIDMSTGFHFRPESRGFLLRGTIPKKRLGYKTDFDASFIEKILTRAADRVPSSKMVAVNPKRAWAGLYEMTPTTTQFSANLPSPGFFFATLQRTRRDARARNRKNSLRSDSDGEDRFDRRVFAELFALRGGRMIQETPVL